MTVVLQEPRKCSGLDIDSTIPANWDGPWPVFEPAEAVSKRHLLLPTEVNKK